MIEFIQEMNGTDSSQAASAPNDVSSILKNKVYYAFKQLVVMICIENYKNYKNKKCNVNDNINVKTMLNYSLKYDLVYQVKMVK